jgi:transcriptional regulator with XRE-family HTH domain
VPGFPEKLTALMAERGLTQATLAERSGVKQTTISTYVRGKSEASWPNIQKLARALGVSCLDLQDDAADLPPVPSPPVQGRRVGSKKKAD